MVGGFKKKLMDISLTFFFIATRVTTEEEEEKYYPNKTEHQKTAQDHFKPPLS